MKETSTKTKDETVKLKKIIEQQKAEIFRLKNVIDNIPADVYWKNKKGIWLGLNRKSSEDLREVGNVWKIEDVIGKTDYELYKKETADVFRKNDLEVMQKGEEISHEEINILPSGKKIVQLSIKKPLKDENNKIVGIIGISSDITYLKDIEKQLTIEKEKAEAANKAKSEFIANMSHDIRTPLSGIIGISAMLEEEVNTLQEKEHAHWVNVSGEQLLSLLNSVLDIVSMNDKVESNIELEAVNIHQLLQGIVDLELPTIKLKHLELTVNIDPSVPEFIKTDPIKLHRILLNLLGNAIKFTDKGGITINVQCSDTNSKKKQLILIVSDTGMGIAKKYQDKVFDRFYRSNPSYKGQHKGFGVGLHIVEQYVALLNGQISLKSKLGKGTTFTVVLPVNLVKGQKKIVSKIEHKKVYDFSHPDELKPTTKENSTLPPTKNHAPYLLIIEDNAIALKVAESVAKKANCQYLSATTAEHALELFKAHEFDLVLSDIGLPSMSGNDFAMTVREIETCSGKKAIPIVGLTAHAANIAEQESLSAGMNKVISKPINLSLLNELLNHFILEKQQKSIIESEKHELGEGLPETEDLLFELEKYPLLDIEEGIKVLGSEAAVKDMIPLFIDQSISKEDLTNFNDAFANKDWKTASAIAHKLKGACIYCGVVRMHYASQYLERYYKAGHTKLLNKLCQQFLTVLDQTKEQIATWIQANQ